MPNPTYDYEAEQGALARRKKIAETLQMQAMQPLQGNNLQWAQLLGQMAMGYAGMKQQDKLAAQEQELGKRYRDDLVAGVQKYSDTMQGKPAVNAYLPDLEGGGKMQEIGAAVPGNPKQAMIDALASNVPVLQQLGTSQLQALGKKEGLSQKDVLALSGYDAKSKIAAALAGGDISKLAPETKEHVVNNQIVAGIPGEAGSYKPIGDFRDRFDVPGQVALGPDNRPIIGQREQTTGKVTFAPAGTNVNVDTGMKAGQAFAKQLGEKRADLLTKSFEKAQEASNSLQNLNAAAEDFAAGIKSGAPAQISLGLAKWGKALGIGDGDPAIANTESFRANMAQQVLSSVKALGSGTGISNADREYAEKAAGGHITLDDQAMYRLMNIARASAANTLINHHALVERNSKASGAVPEDLDTFRVPFTIPVGDDLDWSPSAGKVVVRSKGPAAPKPGTPSNAPIPGSKPAAGGAISWQDYLKSQGM